MAARKTTTARSWASAKPAPLVLLSGPERLLAARAVDLIVQQVRAARGTVAVTRLDASSAGPGALRMVCSPSLFDEPGIVVVDAFEAMSEGFLVEAIEYAAQPDADVVAVFHHAGGVRGKRALDAIRSAGAQEYACAAIKRDSEFVDFVAAEFVRAGAKVPADTVRALVDAVGADVAELASACAQLASDVDGTVTPEHVARYYGTRVNATGFAVADAVATGKSAEALALVRHALASGTDPVPVVAALASKLRTMAKVGAARGRRVNPAQEFGLAPWQVDRARRDLRHWDAERVAVAVEVIARADADIKGAARHPRYAVERAVRELARLAADDG